MCLSSGSILGLGEWNWDGDEIVQETIVPSKRPTVGKRTGSYDIDVREYIATEHNAVIRKTLREDVPAFLKTLLAGDRAGAGKGDRLDRHLELFRSSRPGSFDQRAHILSAYVSHCIVYKKEDALENHWQLPDETLHLHSGLCEDRAFLLASLLLSSGVSPYNVRVALGRIESQKDGARPQSHDHMWVMYKNERGRWTLLDPLVVRQGPLAA
jgi:hypothetical protein